MRLVRLSGVATEDVYDLYLKGGSCGGVRQDGERLEANAVYISVHPSTWSDHPEQLMDLLQQHVNAGTDAGLSVIVDYHVIGFPEGYYQPVPPEWGDAPDLYDSDFVLVQDFWDTVSTGIQYSRGRQRVRRPRHRQPPGV